MFSIWIPTMQLQLRVTKPKALVQDVIPSYIHYAKQKHLGCKEVQGQSEAACKQEVATKRYGIS